MSPTNQYKLGMTLIEITMTVGLMVIVMGALFSLSLGISDTVQNYSATATATDEARRALTILVPRLSQASRQTVNWNELPGSVLRFRMPADLDGNGSCVDVAGNLELGDVVTIQRDTQDANGDGLTDNQLVMIQGNNVTVLANHLFNPPESANPDGSFNDTNGNGRLDRGFFVTAQNNTLQIFIDTFGESRRGHQFVINVDERVTPRNP